MRGLKVVGLYDTKIEEAEQLRASMPNVHIEVYVPGQSGVVFDESGCYSSEFLRRYM